MKRKERKKGDRRKRSKKKKKKRKKRNRLNRSRNETRLAKVSFSTENIFSTNFATVLSFYSIKPCFSIVSSW